MPFLVEPGDAIRRSETSIKSGEEIDLISLCFPESMTQVMSGIVMPVSAILVAVQRDIINVNVDSS